MKLEGTRFVISPGGSSLGLPAGEYWAVPDSMLRDAQSQLAQALANAESATQERDGEWVSCEERMPEPVEDETVLMYFATTEVLTGAWDGEDWLHGDTIIPRRHVTHWMPLPAPPQPKDKP